MWPLVLIGGLAVADTSSLPPLVEDALASFDTVPTKQQLDDRFAMAGSDALTGLTRIASGLDNPDTGVRLRAIHALSKYCTSPCNASDAAHVALAQLIGNHASDQSGEGVVMLRGAIEALGPQRVTTDLPLLVPLLDHASRDVRAATAHAMRDLCNTQAINPLHVRYQHEATDQVRLAITDALRVLGQPPCQ